MSPDPDTTLPRPGAGARRGPDTAQAAPSVPRARSAWRGRLPAEAAASPRPGASRFTSTEREVSDLGVVSLQVPNVPRGRRRGEAAQPPTVRPVIQSLSQLQVISLLLVSERLHSLQVFSALQTHASYYTLDVWGLLDSEGYTSVNEK